MRVAVVTEQALAATPGGTGRYTVELAAALARTADPGDTLAGWTALHRDVSAARVDRVAGPRRLPLGPRVLARLWVDGRGPAPRRADLVHAPTLLVPPARAGVALVVTAHDAVPWTHPETLTAHGARWHRRMGERAVLDAAAVVVPTTAVAHDLLTALPGLAGRLHVTGAGVAPVFVAVGDGDGGDGAGGDGADGDGAGAAGAITSRLPARFVLSLATREPRKGLDVLVRALAQDAAHGLHLVSVGSSGWGDVDLPAWARDAGIAPERVHVLGRVSDADLVAVMRRARAVVVPSRSEGFGLPVVEAMAAGVPVVCTDVPALVEVAGGAAQIVPVDDVDALAVAMAAVDTDTALRDRLVAAGRARAAEFTWDAVAARTWALYRELLPGG